VDHELVIALAVTGIGMLVLFVTLSVLCGLMYLMTACIKDRPKAEAEEPGRRDATGQTTRRRRAAVIAVALARAEYELSTDKALSEQEMASAWRELHHHRQLILNLPKRRVR
jgi:Na+-transporting methylmalonyl-CoA/oxaloacetate decarboxylase gamma subunit